MKTFSALLFISGSTLALVGWDAGRCLQQPLRLKETVTLDVPPGASFGKVRDRLIRQELLSPRTAMYLTVWAHLSGSVARIKAGEYRVTPDHNALQMLNLLVSGKTHAHTLTLIEGWRFEQALAAVWAHPAIQKTLVGKSPAEIMLKLGAGQQHSEGRFLPETYQFSRGTSDLVFLRRAYKAMQTVLAETWAERQSQLPYSTADEALVLASIVEKETSVPQERSDIAGVFARRLQVGMKLQTDPTVIYGIGPRFDGNLRRRDLLKDTPYNTYTRRGLPPTPICLPGRDALQAVVNPAAGDSLFFVARGDGTHYFSATLEQHNAAVRKYQLKNKS